MTDKPTGAPTNGEVPYVAAAQARKRVPLWAVPIFPLLLVWGLIYVNAVQPPENKKDPIAQGGAIYSKNCAGCHGATGGGGSGPSFNGGSLAVQFPKWQEQVRWVNVGATNWPTATYGTKKKPVADHGMPGFGPLGNVNSLTCADIVLVVNYERSQLSAVQPASLPGEQDLATMATAIAAGQVPTDIPNCPGTK